jgi:RNA polymerase sigma-70 factor (TIGR02957 family)
MTELAELHDDLRPLMFSIAYRMLGSVAEAEDVVQEAFLRMHKTTLAGTHVESPDAFATTVTTRLAIDALRSARMRREQYAGPWLPEPVADDALANPAHRVELDETVSVAFLLVLGRLSPVERAVFLLREVFGYGYDEVSAIVGKSEANCRQLFSRARRHIDDAGTRFDPSPARRAALAEEFFAAVRDGDLAGLERMLAEDVVFYGDGGGKVAAIAHPLSGRVQVIRFVLGLFRRGRLLGVGVEVMRANGQPALRLVGPDGELYGVLSIAVVDGQVAAIHNQINPDKLQHLGHVGDLNAFMSQPR